ncbi:MAG: CPBP family intramembrane metalloprotease [Lachnospiraceae bacterium]|nr:CPBP family intramembrane metalloprotease [Ruminococcus sp.]MCM1274465.1 CPBP family intramembrane metalloprotease [Lachnospiraceae bacterium]
MKKLYEKNELGFALMWIGIYLVAMTIGDNVSEVLGLYKSVTAALVIALMVFVIIWLGKNGLLEKFGLGKAKFGPAAFLFFIPLIAIPSVNVWYGVTAHIAVPWELETPRELTAAELALAVVSMIGVGFLEELIFRGFLFKAIAKSSVKRAVIISAVTFGVGHIVNLFNGSQDLLLTVLQICYAIALGFLFTIIFHRSGTLVPCIIAHQAVNSLSIFAVDRTPAQLIIISVFLIALSALYSVWIIFKTKPKNT